MSESLSIAPRTPLLDTLRDMVYNDGVGAMGPSKRETEDTEMTETMTNVATVNKGDYAEGVLNDINRELDKMWKSHKEIAKLLRELRATTPELDDVAKQLRAANDRIADSIGEATDVLDEID